MFDASDNTETTVSSRPGKPNRIAIGIDSGSTTVKAVVCNPDNLQILWSDYQRHGARQAEKVLEFMLRIEAAFAGTGEFCVFCTGSGGEPLAKLLGARFVQEVNAVTLAVERFHPDVNSVIELGGQDAKLILFREHTADRGEYKRQVIVSMNDRCAAGTGTIIDKCMLKVGMSQGDAVRLNFDPHRLHRVAARCGVFAETDVVNLIKSGVPADEIMNSLADAIVRQNLSLLARGNTLRPKVLLLGGPNTYLPFLADCWRLRIPERWQARNYPYPQDVAVDRLIFTPDNAQYYAAFGAIVFGITDGSAVEWNRYRGLDDLQHYLLTEKTARVLANATAPLVKNAAERDAFLKQYPPASFTPATLTQGQQVHGVIGLDCGSTSSKAVLIDYHSGEILYKAYTLSKGNPIQDVKEILSTIKHYVAGYGATLVCRGCGVTGYAAAVLEETLGADVNLAETIAHLLAAIRYVPDADVVCDIGGQDIKVLLLSENKAGGRDVKDFRLSNQCSAGNGMLLQAMADQFGIPLQAYAETAFMAALASRFSCGCAVFLDSDRVNFQKEGFTAPQMLAGLAQVLPQNVWQYVAQTPRLAELGRVFVLQGGTQRNPAAVKAQVDYIAARVPDARIVVHPHCGEAGCIGVALETLRVVKTRGHSTFIGLEQAVGLDYTTRNDESTVCQVCPNHCSRSFIETRAPNGRTSRYIAGCACDKGSVEGKNQLKHLLKEQARVRQQYPNLVAEETALAFKHLYDPIPLPAAGSPKPGPIRRRPPSIGKLHRTCRRGFQRSGVDLGALKIGLPRVLNLYSTGPFFRAYFETLGVPSTHLIWSSITTEKLWVEGSHYGSTDPCFPAKVAQAHIHELLFHAHTDCKARRGPLNYIYYPCITHVPSWVTHTLDNTCCTLAAGSPNVIKAAFTKEIDFFAQAGVEFVDDNITLTEPNLLKRQLFKTWGPRLGVTEDESDWAVQQGFEALKSFDRYMESRGREVLSEVERDNRIAILVLSRPYHNDPGINHGILEALQLLGYPVLSMRSIPKDWLWLQRYFGLTDPLDVRDAWPENYSTNSVQKVWAARFAARHPHIAVLDLSSFKCGHDAPTYGIIDKILSTARVPRLTLHDIDANKPGGSILIRLKTYAHTLRQAQEELASRPVAPVLPPYDRVQWREPPTSADLGPRDRTTILLGGLTHSHDRLCCAALRGLGYQAVVLDCPDQEALQLGKEFGNRGQCNPTYFIAGNLLKHLIQLRDHCSLPTQQIIDRYVFVTIGSCGPCRFGAYISEYRKVLRDAGFQGFRVLLFQQQLGIKGVESNAIDLVDSHLTLSIIRALILGDVLNLLGYRLRPYETVAGTTDTALEQCRQILSAALENRRSVVRALYRCRCILRRVAIDRSVPKPVVSIIGEFWAMTTEGEGNHQLQRFLEEEGVEVDIQGITNWLLYLIWGERHTIRERMALRQYDLPPGGLGGMHPTHKLWELAMIDGSIRGIFQIYATLIGLHGYHLPDMDKIARLAGQYYNINVSGGEGHLEVGKLIHAVEDRLNHMTISVKPFGCIPSSGVSDGVQSLITARWPEAIFLPVETTGDSRTNVYSRVQMMLFKARQRTRAEFEQALAATGLDQAAFRRRLANSLYGRYPLLRPKHRVAGLAANLVYELGGAVSLAHRWFVQFVDNVSKHLMFSRKN